MLKGFNAGFESEEESVIKPHPGLQSVINHLFLVNSLEAFENSNLHRRLYQQGGGEDETIF